MSLGQFFGNQGFDPQSVEPQADFDVLAPGKYSVQIEKADVKVTKKGNGHLLELQMVVLDGPGKGRKLWSRINIDNPSQQCVEIGLKCLAALGRATKVGIVSDESQFLGRTCVACVKVKDGNNEIRTYEPFPDAQSVQAPAPPPTAPQAPLPVGPPVSLPVGPPVVPPQPAQQPLQQPLQQPVAPLQVPAQQTPPQQPTVPWKR